MMLAILAVAAALWSFFVVCSRASQAYGGESFWIAIGVPAAVLAPPLAFVSLVGIAGHILA